MRPLAFLTAVLLAGCGATVTGGAEPPAVLAVEPALRPEPAKAKNDIPELYGRGCRQTNESAAVLTCSWGKKNAATRIAIVGDSKAAQWSDAITPAAEKQNWRIVSYIKSGCDFADVDQDLRPGVPHSTCRPWVKNVLKRITGPEKPDVVILSQRGVRARDDKNNLARERTRMREAMTSTWRKLTAAGIRVVVIADNPEPAMEVPDCISKHGQKSEKCTFDTSDGVTRSAAPLQLEVTRALGGRQVKAGGSVPRGFEAPVYVDLVEQVCPTEVCRPVADDILKYRQGSHLTATFVRSLTSPMRRLLKAAGIPTR